MRDGADGAALLQNPNHLPAPALDVEEAFQRVIVGKIGRLTKPQAQGLATGPANKCAHPVPLGLRQGAGKDDDFAEADIAARPGNSCRIPPPRTCAYSCCKLLMRAMIASNSGRMHTRCSHDRLSFTQRALDHENRFPPRIKSGAGFFGTMLRHAAAKGY